MRTDGNDTVGMRFAKLENNIIIAFFIAMFEISLCDKKGNPVSEPPPTNFNKPSAAKPDPTAYIKYRVRK